VKQILSFIRGYDQHDSDLYTWLTWFYIFFPVFSHMVFPGTTKQSAETMSQTHQGCCHGFPHVSAGYGGGAKAGYIVDWQ
jgi:hypothetical protein